MEETERLTFLELLYGILFQPRRTFKVVAATNPLFYSFLILIGVNFTNSLVGALTTKPVDYSRFWPGMPTFSFITMLFSGFFAIGLWFLTSAILQMFAEFLGGKGRGREVMTVIGVSSLPQILRVPFMVLAYLAGLPSIFLIIITFPLFVWSQLVLPILGLREVQGFSLGRAMLTVLAPLITIVTLMIVLFFGTLSLILPFLGSQGI